MFLGLGSINNRKKIGRKINFCHILSYSGSDIVGIEKAWHEIRFKMSSDRIRVEQEPIHLLLSNEILYPCIEAFENKMDLWRIHRMYEYPEPRTHRFMFKFFGTEDICSPIKDKVESYRYFDALKKHESIEVEGFVKKGMKIQNDNDENWPDEIKAVWPYYICGVSKAWLKLVKLIADKQPDLKRDISFEKRLEVYAEVNRELDDKWLEHGKQAMFHHLNAVFGYKYLELKAQSQQIPAGYKGILLIG